MKSLMEEAIIRYLSGNATDEEAREILTWKKQNTKNRQFYKEIEIAFNTTEINLNPDNYNASTVYSEINSILNNKVISFRRRIVKRVAGYAASVVITVGLTLVTQNYLINKEVTPVALASTSQTIETPAGAKSIVTLEDGTKIWLNANSKLTYPTHFERDQRIVQLEGEGYFVVSKDKTCPFTVKTSDLSIDVLGTTFNVKSYPEEGLIETTLIEGEITLNKLNNNEEEKEILKLKPSQKATFIKKEGRLLADEIFAAEIPTNQIKQRTKEKLIIDENVEAERLVAWKDNKMIFVNETFESIAVELERRYGAKIKFQDKEVKKYRFSGAFEEISIDQALNALQFASSFKFEVDQDLITIKK